MNVKVWAQTGPNGKLYESNTGRLEPCHPYGSRILTEETEGCKRGRSQLILQIQTSQAVLDFMGITEDAHSLLHHDFAGEADALLASLPKVKLDPAVLAILVPTEPAICHVLRRQELHTPQQCVVLRNFKTLAANFDLYEP